MLAARCARVAAARSRDLRGLRVPRRDALRGRAPRLPRRRSADHLRRAPARRVETVERRRHRVGDRAVANRRRRLVTRAERLGPRDSCYVLGTSYMSASPPEKPASLSIFFPAYNDGGTIASMVIRAVKSAADLTPDFEIIVVDDGSAGDRRHRRRARADLSTGAGGASPDEPRLRRRPAN